MKRAQAAREKVSLDTGHWESTTPLPTIQPTGTAVPQTPGFSTQPLKMMSRQEIKIVTLQAAVQVYMNRQNYGIDDVLETARKFEKYLLE